MTCLHKITEGNLNLCTSDGECQDKGKFSKVVMYKATIGFAGTPVYGNCYRSETEWKSGWV